MRPLTALLARIFWALAHIAVFACGAFFGLIYGDDVIAYLEIPKGMASFLTWMACILGAGVIAEEVVFAALRGLVSWAIKRRQKVAVAAALAFAIGGMVSAPAEAKFSVPVVRVPVVVPRVAPPAPRVTPTVPKAKAPTTVKRDSDSSIVPFAAGAIVGNAVSNAGPRPACPEGYVATDDATCVQE